MISEAYRDKIISFFGDLGRQWLEVLPDLLSKYQTLWGLSEIKVCQLSYNFVATCYSKTHGPSVLKIALPEQESLTEMYALEELHHHCKVYEKAQEDYVLLLEHVQPGHDLWTIRDIGRRLDIAAPLIMSVPTVKFSHTYPKHFSWLERIHAYLIEHKPEERRIVKHLDQAMTCYSDLAVDGNDVRLLHGDLHHYNILKDHDWTVIDPKGVIGRRSLEVGRYMNNQIQEKGIDRDKALRQMVQRFSQVLQLPSRVILLSFYVDMVLSTAWYYEGDSLDYDGISNKLDICDWVYGKIL